MIPRHLDPARHKLYFERGIWRCSCGPRGPRAITQQDEDGAKAWHDGHLKVLASRLPMWGVRAEDLH